MLLAKLSHNTKTTYGHAATFPVATSHHQRHATCADVITLRSEPREGAGFCRYACYIARCRDTIFVPWPAALALKTTNTDNSKLLQAPRRSTWCPIIASNLSIYKLENVA
jgi:hypothetical protein